MTQMPGSLPFDLTEIIAAKLAEGRRDNDHLLHASSHLVGSLRHAQLATVGAPTIDSKFVSDVRMETGTMWHRAIQDALVKEGIPFMQEVNLTPWLPKGWGGTADLLFWVPNGGKDDKGGFVLRDVKTTKGEAIKFRLTEGASEEHVWQISMYYHGCVRMGLPMIRECGIYYLPMNDDYRSQDEVRPVEVVFEPLEWAVIRQQAEFRNKRVEEYQASLDFDWRTTAPSDVKKYVTPKLEPVQDRTLKASFSKRDQKWELKMVPHWSAQFCPYPDSLCDCSTAGVTKVGEWGPAGNYMSRAGYENISPPPFPGGK